MHLPRPSSTAPSLAKDLLEVCSQVASRVSLPKNCTLILPGGPVLVPQRQYTARLWMVSFVASENRGSGWVRSRSRPVTYSPTAGPCLNPCPDPPPANQTFSIPGCRSIRKSPLEVFSYWQTRVSTIGESLKTGNRSATYARTLSLATGETILDSVSGSTRSPCPSYAIFNPRLSMSGIP